MFAKVYKNPYGPPPPVKKSDSEKVVLVVILVIVYFLFPLWFRDWFFFNEFLISYLESIGVDCSFERNKRRVKFYFNWFCKMAEARFSSCRAAMQRAADRAAAQRERMSTGSQIVDSRDSILPKRSSLFGSKMSWTRVTHRSATREDIKLECDQIATLSNEIIDVSIPIINQQQIKEEPVFDERLSLRARSNVNNNNAAYVGAVEIVIDGMVARSSDAVVGGVLYDARHYLVENSMRLAFTASLALDPVRVLVFPDHSVSLLGGHELANTSLRLALVCPNFDGRPGDIFAHVQAGSVSQLTKNSREQTHTRFLVESANRDRFRVQNYVNENRYFIAGRSEPSFKMPNIEVPLARSISMRQVGSSKWAAVEEKRQSICLTFEDSVVHPGNEENAQNQVLEEEVFAAQAILAEEVQDIAPLPSFGSDCERAIAQGSFDIPVTVAEGSVLSVIPLAHMMAGGSAYNKQLRAMGVVKGSLKVRMFCTISRLSGLAMHVGYLDVALNGTAISIPKVHAGGGLIWAPNSDRDILEYNFSPFSCMDGFDVNMFEHQQGSLVTSVVYPWADAPTVAARCKYVIYFDPAVVIPPCIYDLVNPGNFPWRQSFGRIEIKLGVHDKAFRCVLEPGWPIQHGAGISYTLAQAVLSYYKYVKMAVRLRIRRLSSPFVSATLAVALLPWDLAWAIDGDDLETIPHNIFQVDGVTQEHILNIPKDRFFCMMNTERYSLVHKVNFPNPVVAIWVRDSVTGPENSALNLAISVESVGEIEVSGSSTGFVLTDVRAQDFNFHHWQDMFLLDLAKVTEEKSYDVMLNMGDNGSFVRLHSPLSHILETCVWARGLIEWKVVWFSDETRWSAKTAHMSVEVHKHGATSGLAYFRHSSPYSNGEITFVQEVCGPYGGFDSRWKYYDTLNGDILRLKPRGISEFAGVNIMARVVSLQVSGNVYGPTFKVKGTTSAVIEL